MILGHFSICACLGLIFRVWTIHSLQINTLNQLFIKQKQFPWHSSVKTQLYVLFNGWWLDHYWPRVPTSLMMVLDSQNMHFYHPIFAEKESLPRLAPMITNCIDFSPTITNKDYCKERWDGAHQERVISKEAAHQRGSQLSLEEGGKSTRPPLLN